MIDCHINTLFAKNANLTFIRDEVGRAELVGTDGKERYEGCYGVELKEEGENRGGRGALGFFSGG